MATTTIETTTIEQVDVVQQTGSTAVEPRWWSTLGVPGAQQRATVRFGAAVVDDTGRPLGRVEALGIDTAGVLTTIVTDDMVYPAAALRRIDDHQVVLDPHRRARVRVAREWTARTPVWSTDDTEFRLQGVVVGADGRRIEGIEVARHRQPTVVPWDVVRPEPDGVALAMTWSHPEPPFSVRLVRRLFPATA